MRRSWCRVGFAVLTIALVLLPLSSAQRPPPPPSEGPAPQPPGDVKPPELRLKYFLHFNGEEGGACDAAQLALKESDVKGAEKCGEVQPQLPCMVTCTPPSPLSYPWAGEFNKTVYMGYQGKVQLNLWFDLPDRITATGSIRVGNMQCGFSTPQTPVEGNDWVMLEEECRFMAPWGGPGIDKPAASTDVAADDQNRGPSGGPSETKGTGSLNFELQVHRLLNYYVGHEGTHSGWFEFDAVPPEQKNHTDNRSRVKETPKGEAPGPALGFGVAVLLAIVETVRRRRA